MKRLPVSEGQRFGKWTVIRYEGNDSEGRAMYLCQCECGAVGHVSSTNLVYRKSCACPSCGHKKETTYSNTKLYGVWRGIHRRCENPKSKDYPRYGGRGIQVCEEWSEFLPFRNWALSAGYQEGLTVERRDNDGNYCPENCSWETRKTQANNTRHVHWLEYNGEKKTLTEAASEVGLTHGALQYRLKKYPVEIALSTPKKKAGPYRIVAKEGARETNLSALKGKRLSNNVPQTTQDLREERH